MLCLGKRSRFQVRVEVLSKEEAALLKEGLSLWKLKAEGNVQAGPTSLGRITVNKQKSKVGLSI